MCPEYKSLEPGERYVFRHERGPSRASLRHFGRFDDSQPSMVIPSVWFDRGITYRQLLRKVYKRDDMLVLAPTRWKLRQAVRVVNQALGALKLDQAPDKTFIGRIEKGFDFLGYHFSPEGLKW